MTGSLVRRIPNHPLINRGGLATGRATLRGLVASLAATLAVLGSPGAGILQAHADGQLFFFGSPSQGATYLVGQTIPVAWDCGLIDCTVSPNADALSYSLPGTYTFTITGSTGDGEISATIPFVVTYGICRLDDASKTVITGKTVTIKLELCDSGGNDVSAAGTAVKANSIVSLATGATLPLGSANPAADFKFDPKLGDSGGYSFTLNTKGLAPGDFQLGFLAANDIVQHMAFVRVVAAPPLPFTGVPTVYAGSLIGGLLRLS
jgi:hypothetical protein